MNPGSFSYFGRRGNSFDESDSKVASEYAEKRENLARLLACKEDDDEFRSLEKILCCCPNEHIINCGCVAHGIKSRGC